MHVGKIDGKELVDECGRQTEKRRAPPPSRRGQLTIVRASAGRTAFPSAAVRSTIVAAIVASFSILIAPSLAG